MVDRGIDTATIDRLELPVAQAIQEEAGILAIEGDQGAGDSGLGGTLPITRGRVFQ